MWQTNFLKIDLPKTRTVKFSSNEFISQGMTAIQIWYQDPDWRSSKMFGRLVASAVRPDVFTHRRPEKERVNEFIVEHAEQLFKGRIEKVHALVMDASSLRTSNALIKIGVKAENINVPNPFCFKAMVNNAAKIPVTNKLVYDCIVDEHTPNWDIVILDYCCTWTGNKWCKPQMDIKTLFSKGKLASKSLLFIEVSARFTHPDPKVARVVAKTDNMTIWIEGQAIKYGYNATFVSGDMYHPAMRYMIFSITRFDKPAVQITTPICSQPAPSEKRTVAAKKSPPQRAGPKVKVIVGPIRVVKRSSAQTQQQLLDRITQPDITTCRCFTIIK